VSVVNKYSGVVSISSKRDFCYFITHNCVLLFHGFIKTAIWVERYNNCYCWALDVV